MGKEHEFTEISVISAEVLFWCDDNEKRPSMTVEEHIPVLLDPILDFAKRHLDTSRQDLSLLDVTAGGGGHFFSLINHLNPQHAECWDRDSRAETRIAAALKQRAPGREIQFVNQRFGQPQVWGAPSYDLILADLGVSSFQLEDPSSGMSLHAMVPPDFRMDPAVGEPFTSWFRRQREEDLATIFAQFGEEPKARRLAREMKKFSVADFETAHAFAEAIKKALHYHGSRVHPATRIFQALRIAINGELDELKCLLTWAPQKLRPGGILMVISFHSLEDRFVKNAFRNIVASELHPDDHPNVIMGPVSFEVLLKKPLEATEAEVEQNRRSRTAKLRILKRTR